MLNKPFLALCTDRTKMPKSHPTSGSPEEWFSVSNLKSFNLSGLSFDFFVDWSVDPVKLKKEIWLKLVLSPQTKLTDGIESLPIEIFKLYDLENFRRVLSYFNLCDLKLFVILYNDESNFNNNETEIGKILISLDDQGQISFKPSIISFDKLKSDIRENSGGSVKIGNKGLIYGTSKMECFLSSTDSLYPGDADLILIKENQCIALLEYKKHTLDTPIEKQELSNYYPKPDARKYDRLTVLKEVLSPDKEIPFVNIYYPTLPHIKRGKIEIICGKYQKLKVVDTILFDLPTENSTSQNIHVCELLMEALNKKYCI